MINNVSVQNRLKSVMDTIDNQKSEKFQNSVNENATNGEISTSLSSTAGESYEKEDLKNLPKLTPFHVETHEQTETVNSNMPELLPLLKIPSLQNDTTGELVGENETHNQYGTYCPTCNKKCLYYSGYSEPTAIHKISDETYHTIKAQFEESEQKEEDDKAVLFQLDTKHSSTGKKGLCQEHIQVYDSESENEDTSDYSSSGDDDDEDNCYQNNQYDQSASHIDQNVECKTSKCNRGEQPSTYCFTTYTKPHYPKKPCVLKKPEYCYTNDRCAKLLKCHYGYTCKNPTNILQCCSYCGAFEAPICCTKCGCTFYCGYHCQKLHWISGKVPHRVCCPYLSKWTQKTITKVEVIQFMKLTYFSLETKQSLYDMRVRIGKPLSDVDRASLINSHTNGEDVYDTESGSGSESESESEGEGESESENENSEDSSYNDSDSIDENDTFKKNDKKLLNAVINSFFVKDNTSKDFLDSLDKTHANLLQKFHNAEESDRLNLSFNIEYDSAQIKDENSLDNTNELSNAVSNLNLNCEEGHTSNQLIGNHGGRYYAGHMKGHRRYGGGSVGVYLTPRGYFRYGPTAPADLALYYALGGTYGYGPYGYYGHRRHQPYRRLRGGKGHKHGRRRRGRYGTYRNHPVKFYNY